MGAIISPGAVARYDLAGAYDGFINNLTDFGGWELFPFYKVPKRDIVGNLVPPEAYMLLAEARRRPGSAASRSDYRKTQFSHFVEELAHEESIDPANTSLYRDDQHAETVATRRVMGIVIRAFEQLCANLTFNDSTNFPASGTTGLAVSNAWSDAVNGTPLTDVQTGCENIKGKIGVEPNVLALTKKDWRSLSRSNQITGRIRTTADKDGLIPVDALASLLGVEKIVILDARYNTANQGLTPVSGRIWAAGTAFLARVEQSEDSEAPQLGRSFVLDTEPDSPGVENTKVNDISNGAGVIVEEYAEPAKSSKIIRGKAFMAPKVLFNAAGFRFTGL